MDYAWGYANNEVTFFNSFKMKMSIVIGVSHMLLGIVLKGLNAIHFRNVLDFIFEFVPQLLFMTALFGYMVVLIFVKWARNWDSICSDPDPEVECPAIISTFTSLQSVTAPIFYNAGLQGTIQLAIIATTLICMFLMVFPKPLILGLLASKKYEETDSRSSSGNDQFSLIIGAINETQEPLLADEEKEIWLLCAALSLYFSSTIKLTTNHSPTTQNITLYDQKKPRVAIGLCGPAPQSISSGKVLRPLSGTWFL